MDVKLRPDNELSLRLYESEKADLARLFKLQNSVSLASAIVELWLTDEPKHELFTKYSTGVLCFVKDYTKKSYFFRLYKWSDTCEIEYADTEHLHEIWSQEMYSPFKYHKVTKTFHYFPSNNCNAGINFSFADEAEFFSEIVIEKIMSKVKLERAKSLKIKQQSKTLDKSYKQDSLMVPEEKNLQKSSSFDRHLHEFNKCSILMKKDITSFFASKISPISSTLFRKKSIKKSDISKPNDFRIVQHIGKSATTNHFEINLTDNNMKQMIEELNTSGDDNKRKESGSTENSESDWDAV